MLSCLKPPQTLTPTSTNNYFSFPASQGYSGDNTPTSSVHLSPTINLSREYTLALQSHSYGEIRRTFDQESSVDQHVEIVSEEQPHHLLSHFLRPSRECVQEALSQTTPNSLTNLVSDYFQLSEQTSRLCLHLYHSVYHARLLYSPIHCLLDDLPSDSDSESYSLSHSQCRVAFDAFLQFDGLANPFLPPDSPDFDDTRNHFLDLRQQLDLRLHKSKSRVDKIRNCSTGSAMCLIAATVGVAMSAVAIASHALVALVACPLCPAILASSGLTKREVVHLAQLDAAAKGAYVLHNDLDTVHRLVARLYDAVENDKLLVLLGLERGVDGHSVMEVLKQIRRNRASLVQQLEDLKEHIFLCFATVNRARSLLLHEIHMYQDPD